MLLSMDSFSQTVWQYYQAHGRHGLPWRQLGADGQVDPYGVLVSELMLQQTQVPRVIPKYQSFMGQFPTVQALADAPLANVLTAWSGLGYNRRAKFLWQAAGSIVRDHAGQVPNTLQALAALPGIGPNTAGAIMAYAYNKPVVFVETNIRTVFIYHFLADQENVHDKEVADLVAHSLPDSPRQWYWALMDYGTHLKQTVGNLNTLSKHYAKQSAFQGSRRQVRGQVLRLLTTRSYLYKDLERAIDDERLPAVLGELQQEGLIRVHQGHYKLGGS